MKKYIFSIFPIVILLWLSGPFIYKLFPLLGVQFYQDGQGTYLDGIGKLGDSFGAINSLIAGISLMGVCISLYFAKLSYDSQSASLKEQSEELRKSQELLTLQCEELREQTKQMKRQADEMSSLRNEEILKKKSDIIYKLIEKIDRETTNFIWGNEKGSGAITYVTRAVAKDSLVWISGGCSPAETKSFIETRLAPQLTQMIKLIHSAAVEIGDDAQARYLLKSFVVSDIKPLMEGINRKSSDNTYVIRVCEQFYKIPSWVWEVN